MPDIPRKPLDAALVWCRRDLRAHDHAALYHALRAARRVWVAFVFDRAILDALPRADRRVEFIRDRLVDLDRQLRSLALSHGIEGCSLLVRHGQALQVVPALACELGVQPVYANGRAGASLRPQPAALCRAAGAPSARALRLGSGAPRR